MIDRREFLGLGLAAAPALLGRGPAHGAWALVTADTEAHVAVVDLARGRVVQRLATLAGPRSIERAGGWRAIVGHADAGAVSLLEGRPLRVRRVLRGFGVPRYAAVAPGGRLAYVSDAGHGEVAVVDLVAGRVVRRVGVGDGARHLGLHPRGHLLWIALGSSATELAVVDLRDPLRPRPVGRVRPPFPAHDVAFAPEGRRVWVTAGRERRIAVYAPVARSPVRVLGADAAPQHVSFGPGVAYVASGDDGRVRVHARANGAVRRRVAVPRGSYNVQASGGRVLTPSLGTGALTVLDARGAVVREVRAARAAHDACVA